MAQTWRDLLFAHWRVPAESLRPHLPEGLELEERDGGAWLGITPFRLTNLRLRATLPVPFVSSFPELNVRTYVRAGGRPGIWFFSLDTSSRLAVEAARRTYRLPYFQARASAERDGDWVDWSSARGSGRVFHARYRPRGEVFHAAPGSLEEFLAERYCLYAEEAGRLYRAEIHHPPWPLQAAEARIELNTMAPRGVELPDEEPVLHFAAKQDVLLWPLEPLD